MKKFVLIVILISSILILIYLFLIKNNINNKVEKFQNKKNKLFYNIDEINVELKNIKKYKKKMYDETLYIYQNNTLWNTWPETNLYSNKDGWKIFPFYAFGIWMNNNCIKCPTIYNFIKKIKGLKLATLSKLSPHTKLDLHKGWGLHSNYVIRCHYGLIVPNNCYIYVEDENNKEIKFQKQFEWVLFDDSKSHFAENASDFDRIVLIIDIERPDDIEVGQSILGNTKELEEIVNYYKQQNLI